MEAIAPVVDTIIIVTLVSLNLVTIKAILGMKEALKQVKATTAELRGTCEVVRDATAEGNRSGRDTLEAVRNHSDMDRREHRDVCERVKTLLQRQEEHGRILAEIQARIS